MHAPELELVCLYDWISHCQRVKSKANKSSYSSVVQIDKDPEIDEKEEQQVQPQASLLKFLPQHPLSTTHASCWLAPNKARIPNLIGTTIPCCDQGD